MRRLLCIIDSLNVGGAETFLMKVMRCLSSNEYQFDFIVSKKGGFYESEILERGGRIYEVPPRRKKIFTALNAIRKIVKQNNYQHVLRLGDEPIVGIDLLSAKLGGAEHLAFRSCNALVEESYISKAANFMMRPVLNRLATVRIAPSTFAAEFTFGKKHAKNTNILHNGVDLSKFYYDDQGRESVRSELGLQQKFVVGHIGRFNKQKNHRYLLAVFGEIVKQHSESVLLLVGSGEDQVLIRRWILELGLEDKVVMTGQRIDIPQVLSAMDVFVFPSLYEGMPNTVIEAQATGLPCVIADTITPEANITGLVKYLSLNDLPQKWATSALDSIKNERPDTKMQFVEQGYDIESVSNQFLKLVFRDNR